MEEEISNSEKEVASLHPELDAILLEAGKIDETRFVWKTNIQSDITKITAVAIGTIAIFSSITIYLLGKWYLTQFNFNKLLDNAQSNVIFVNQALNSRAEFMQSVANSKDLNNNISQLNSAEIQKILSNYVVTNPDIEGIWIVDEAGRVKYYNDTTGTGTLIDWTGAIDQSYSGASWFTACKLQKDPRFYPDRQGVNTAKSNLPKNMFMWTYPFQNGCIVVLENTIQISSNVYRKLMYLRKVYNTKSMQIHILDNQGKVYWSSDSEWDQYIGNDAKFNPVKQYVQKNEGGTGIEDIHDEKRMFSWSHIKSHLYAQENVYWENSVMVQVDLSEVYSPLNYLIGTLIFLSILITLGASYFSYRRGKIVIHNPLIKLENVIEDIGNGNLSQKDIRIDDHGDLGYIAYGVNRMVAKIRGLIALLMKSGDTVLVTSRDFFISLGSVQESSVKQSRLLVGATDLVYQSNDVLDEIFKLAQKQLDGAETNKQSMENLSSTFDESAKKRAEIMLNAEKVLSKSIKGVETIDEFSQGMGVISDYSKRIRGIIKVIDDLSDQTNLLSLNASIEAARAAEHGKGFAVVANEVSMLAKRSASSANEIADLIKETVQKIVEVTNKVAGAKELFTQISDAMKGLDNEIAEMAEFTKKQETAVHETAYRASNVAGYARDIADRTLIQSKSSEELTGTMKQLNEITRDNVNEVEKVDEILQNFMRQIHTMIEAAGQFTIEDSSTSEQ